MSGPTEQEEQVVLDRLNAEFSVFDDQITDFMQAIVGHPSAETLAEGVRRCLSFETVLDSFDDSGLPRVAERLAECRNTVATTEDAFHNIAKQKVTVEIIPYQGRASDGGPGVRTCPPDQLMRKMQAYRGLLSRNWQPDAAEAWVDFVFGK